MADCAERIEELQRALLSDARIAPSMVDARRVRAHEAEVEGPAFGDAALRIRCADKTIYVCGHEPFSEWGYFVTVRPHRGGAGSSGSWFPYAARDLLIARIRGEVDARAA
jgi:hypothetical protein